MELSNNLPLVERKNSASNPVWMDALRMLLGIFLFVKGISFLMNTSDIFYQFTQEHTLVPFKKAPMLYSVVHIIGGLMIAFGCLTRFALLCHIPILLGAVFFVNSEKGLRLENVELWISILVLFLLLFFMVAGPGRYSVDNKIFRQAHKPSA